MKLITVALCILAIGGCTVYIAMHDHDNPIPAPSASPAR